MGSNDDYNKLIKRKQNFEWLGIIAAGIATAAGAVVAFSAGAVKIIESAIKESKK